MSGEPLSDERLAEIRERHQPLPTDPPLCCVCGKPLEVGGIGDGRVTWACYDTRLPNGGLDVDHYRRSEVYWRQPSSDVLVLLAEVDRLREQGLDLSDDERSLIETVRAEHQRRDAQNTGSH